MGKKLKHHSLIDKVYKRLNLYIAFEKVKANRGAGGIDRISLEEFERKLDFNLEEIHRLLYEDKYQPQAVRRVFIPKPNGDKRPLGIPTIRDRVVQQALLNRIGKIFEAKFMDCSFGFRPNRSAHGAIQKVEEYLKEGYQWVVEVDIKSFFDTVEHERLIDLVAEEIADGRVLRLIRSFLKSGIMDEIETRYQTTGTPQGGVITPPTQLITLCFMALECVRTRDWDRMFNRQCIIRINQNFFNKKPKYFLFGYHIQVFCRLPQTAQEFFEAPSKLTILLLIHSPGFQSLQFRFQCCFSLPQFWNTFSQLFQRQKTFLISIQQTVYPFLSTFHLSKKSLFPNFCWIRVSSFFNSSFNFSTNQVRIFKQLNQVLPYQIIQVILPYRLTMANASIRITVIVRTQTAIIIYLFTRCPCRTSIISISTFTTNQDTLQKCRHLGGSQSKKFIRLQSFLGERKGLVTNNSRYRNFNPLPSRSFPTSTRTRRKSTAHPQTPCDLLSLSSLCFAKTGSTFISGVTQYSPNNTSIPRRYFLPGRDTITIEPSYNSAYTQHLFSIKTIHFSDNTCLFFDNFIKGRRSFGLFNIPISIRSSTKYINQTSLRTVSFAASMALSDLSPFVFCDHPLKLQKELFFRSSCFRRLNKKHFSSMFGKLFHQKNLIGIFTTKSIWRIDKNRLNLSFYNQIPQSFQSRTHQKRSTIAFILKDPLRRNSIPIQLGIFIQRHYLATDGLIFFLPVRRYSGVNGCCFHALLPHQLPLSILRSCHKNFSLEPKNYRLETTYDSPTYQKHTTYKAFCDDFYRPFLTLLRKTSKASVTIPLKDSFLNFANSLKARARLSGSLTVKTIFRSGIGNGLLDFCASTIYRYACRPDTPYLRANRLTTLGMARPFPNNAIAVLIRGTTSTSGVFVISHHYNTFHVIMSSVIFTFSPFFPHTVIPAPMVGQNMLKLKVIDCVGGVISPLLANIYLHPYDEKMTAEGYKVVRYADDVIILCQKRGMAERALERTRQILQKELGLMLNEEKTRIIHKSQPFEFLGYLFGRGYSDYKIPRKQAIDSLKDKVRWITRRQQPKKLEQVINELNPVIRGWRNYFIYGNCKRVFWELDCWIENRLRAFKVKKWGLRTHLKMPHEVFEKLGLATLNETFYPNYNNLLPAKGQRYRKAVYGKSVSTV